MNNTLERAKNMNILQEDEVLNVGIVIFDEVEVLDFCGPFEVFSVTSNYTVYTKRKTGAFKVFTIAEQDHLISTRGGMLVQPHFTIHNHPHIDIVVVPGGFGTRKEIDNPVLMTWLARVVQETRLNTSVCTGAFLLGKVGVLEGHSATTHWASLDRFAQAFPNVRVQREVRWVDDTVITSAGVSAGIDMSLHVVERLLGREQAEKTAKQMEYVWQENSRV
jgi:transcriptional regulator GlxA family with amidase domain